MKIAANRRCQIFFNTLMGMGKESMSEHTASWIVDYFLRYHGRDDLKYLKALISAGLRHAYEQGERPPIITDGYLH